MKRKIIFGPDWHNLKPYRVRLALVELATADLGAWRIYEWELWSGSCFVAKGSLPYGDSYLVPADVLDQLAYEYLDKPQLITAEDTRDEAFGL